jgi:MFS family permease
MSSSGAPEAPPVRSSVSATIRSIVWSVYVPSFLLSVGQGILLPVLPGFAAEEMMATAAMVGIVVAARHFGMMAFDVPAGIMVSRVGLRRTMYAGVILFGLASVWAAVSPDLISLILARILAGVAFALWSISRQSYIAYTVPIDVRGRVLSLFGGISRAAMIIGPLIGGLLAEFVGIRVPFYAQAGVAIVTLTLIIWSTRNMVEPVVSSPKHGMIREITGVVSRHRRDFATAGVASIMLQFMRAAREFLIPVWGGEQGFGKDDIGYILTASSIVDSALFPIVGVAMDKWGRKSTGIPAFVILAIAMGLIPLTGSFGTLMAVGLLAGFGNGLSTGFVFTMGTDLAPKENPGEFIGVWRFISDTGGAAGPVMIGGITQVVSLAAASVTTMGIGLLGAFMLVTVVKETMNRLPQQVEPKKSDD